VSAVKEPEPIVILMSSEAITKLSADVERVLAPRPFRLVAPGDPQARHARIAFVSRDVTGLSTKHRILAPTQRMYDALAAAERLEWVHVHSAGADRAAYVDLLRRGVLLTTSSGANASVVAQTAVLGVLYFARHWPQLARARQARRWAPLIETGLPRDLQGQTAVAVGWGPVGQEIGRLLRALGLELIVVRRQRAEDQPGVKMVTHAQLPQVLPRADWLLLACPLTQETRALIGRPELASLPAHCTLVNVSRGEVVDEAALVEALRSNALAGAYLDVFATEPLPADSPLWSLPNVVATPHSAGFSDGNEARVSRMFLDNLGRWLRNEPLVNRASL